MDDRLKKRSADLYGLALITIAAALIRCFIAYNGPLWRDGALFRAITGNGSVSDLIRVLHFHESHPPLFYLLMRTWLAIVGDTDANALMLPIILGVLLVPIMFIVGRSLYSRRTGMIAAGLAAVVPALCEYSAEIRPYSLLPLLVLLSCWLLVLSFERQGLRYWISYALSVVALVYTHNWAWLIIGGQGFAIVVAVLRPGTTYRYRTLQRSVLASLLIATAFLPWLPVLLYQFAHAGHEPSEFRNTAAVIMWIPSGVTTAIQSTLLPFVHFVQVATLVGLAALTTGVVLLAKRLIRGPSPRVQQSGHKRADGTSRIAGRDSSSAETVFLSVAAVATFAAIIFSIRSNMLQPQCLAMLTPLLILPIAGRIDDAWARSSSASARRRLIIALAAIIAIDYCVRLNFLIRTPRSDSSALAMAVSKTMRPSDFIIVVPEWIAPSFNHYYELPNDQIDFPGLSKENSSDFADVWSRYSNPAPLARVGIAITSARHAGRRIWLITDRRSLKALTPTDRRRAAKPGAYVLMSMVRAQQIERMLRESYGPPTTIGTNSVRPRYEDLTGFLFHVQESPLLHAAATPTTAATAAQHYE